MAELVMTAVGPDRPGLVGELTKHLFEGSVNVADSRMVNLRGQFALVVLVEGTDDALTKIRARLPAVAEKAGLALTFAADAATSARSSGVPYRLKTYSMDQPGIVHRFTELLRQRGINIEELSTRLGASPFAGTPLFVMQITMSVPLEVNVNVLRRDLETLSGELNCDVDLEAG